MSILVGAITGALFGGLGALVGGVLMRSADSKLKGRVIWFCVMVGAVASRPVAEQIVEPRLAEMRVEQQLSELPTFTVLRQHYPSEYQQAVGQLRSAIREGQSSVDASNAVRAHISAAIGRALPKADQANTLAMMRLAHHEGVTLRRESETECGSFFSSGTTSLDLQKAFGPDLVARDMQVTAAMLKQAATAPHKWPSTSSSTELDAFAAAALQRGSTTDRARLETWVARGAPSSDLASTCIFTLSLLEELLASPNGKGAAAYQAFSSDQSEG